MRSTRDDFCATFLARHGLAIVVWVLLIVRPVATLAGWRTYVTGAPKEGVTAICEERGGDLWLGNRVEGVYRFDGVAWSHFDTAGGLPSNVINDIVEDAHGDIWIATSAGVSRFDGERWTAFGPQDGFGSGGVLDLHLDRHDILWAVTASGASRFLDGSWSAALTVRVTPGGLVGYLPLVIEDHLGSIWVRTVFDGAWRFDGSSWVRYDFESSYTTGMVEDAAGQVWVSTSSGAYRFDGYGWRAYRTADGLPNSHVETVAMDSTGSVWLGTMGGAARFDGSEWMTLTTADGLPSNLVHRLYADRRGIVWIETNEGVSRFDRKHLEPASAFLSASHAFPVLQDRLGNLWCDSRPLASYDYTETRTYSSSNGLNGNPIWHYGALEDRAGNLWFGTDAGVARFDGANWRTITSADGLPGSSVVGVGEDRAGNLWFGTDVGVSRFDGTSWQTFTPSDGLADVPAWQVLEDRAGNLWFPTYAGVSRFDGRNWETFLPLEPLSDNYVWSMDEDATGNLWFANAEGVKRFDGTDWVLFTPETDGIPVPKSLLCDRSGNVWVGGPSIARFDGSAWTLDLFPEGVRGDVSVILEDPLGNLWFGFGELGRVPQDLAKYDGSTWTTFTPSDGVFDLGFVPMVIERGGAIWFSNHIDVQRYTPDLIPPRTVFLSRPPQVTATGQLTAAYVAGYGEPGRIEFSHRFDGGPWSPWSPVGSWNGVAIQDGEHRLEARSRDSMGNVDPYLATARFTVDATPPAPVIAAPSFGSPVRGTVSVRGTAADARFRMFRVELRQSGSTTWSEATVLTESSMPVEDSVLATWETRTVPDGIYDLRLSVTDSLGLLGSVTISVVVDNEAPYYEQTAPVSIRAATGGDVYTTQAEAHLYFPPHAFGQDALVTLVAMKEEMVPNRLPAGAVRLLPGYQLEWSGSLQKPARFTMSYEGADEVAETPALYRLDGDGNWLRRGGTVDPSARTVTLVVLDPGPYALFSDDGTSAGADDVPLSDVALTPRVFSPTGGFADRRVGIGFRLGQPAPVTVKVFSRSGRLIREVVSAAAMNSGDNVVLWDGRDRSGEVVADGIYLVTVEALGQVQKKPLAVVR